MSITGEGGEEASESVYGPNRPLAGRIRPGIANLPIVRVTMIDFNALLRECVSELIGWVAPWAKGWLGDLVAIVF